MSVVIRVLAILMLACAPAFADGATRVLLADADPELQRAVKTTLAPWRLEVIVEAEHPSDARHARALGDAQTARFVVWREGGDLVVLDRERGEAEHRAAPSGPLDPASAAAAALTVKTLMRLPPPAEAVETEPPVADPMPPDDTGIELRIQGGLATRVAHGASTGRASLAMFVKPTWLPLRLGLAGEAGTDTDVQEAGFKGSWSDWSVVALASWTIALGPRWALEPYAGGGVVRSDLDGAEGMTPHHERATLTSLRGGVVARLLLEPVSLGAVVGFDATLGTPTYTKPGTGAQVFEVPARAFSLGLVVAVDLGR